MKKILQRATRYGATLLIAAAAAGAAYLLWNHYRLAPWTRDGRVRAHVVQVAPDVSGLVAQVLVRDNQVVHKGELLFTLDGERYRLALLQAEAAVRALRVQMAQTQREHARNHALANLVPAELREQTGSRVEQLAAAIAQAASAAELAQLNLERTKVRAPVDGWVTNLELRPGSYATTGKPILALVDQQTLHVVGYFEETKIPRIHVGDAVRVHIIGEQQLLAGHVQGIAAAIEDRELQGGPNLLANVNPTFNWVRLAQRIPVRIQLDSIPTDLQLIMGRTVTVDIVEGASTGPRTLAQGAR